MGRPQTDKRERLVAAAIDRFHRQGFARTSLADVAKAAGTVFYYFKTKDDLACAVVDEWVRLLGGYLMLLEPEPDPWLRLHGFIDQAGIISTVYVTWGCPLAGLVRDLRQAGETTRREAARIYAVQTAWLTTQFRELGFTPSEAEAHAGALMAGYHGSILLAFAQGEAALIDQEAERLKRWLGDLHEGRSGATPHP